MGCPRLSCAEIHGTITGTTNYAWRMYSKSKNDFAIQGNLDYMHSSGFYTGVTVSNFNLGESEVEEDKSFANQAKAEIIPYVGWGISFLDDWRLETQYSRYFYTGKVYEFSGDYNEFYLFLHYKDLVNAAVSFSDDFYGMGGVSYNYELNVHYPITDKLQFSSTFGYAQCRDVLLADYPYWNVGVTATYKMVALDLRYHDATEHYYGNQSDVPNHPETLAATVAFYISVGF